jgi:hypothetical protein
MDAFHPKTKLHFFVTIYPPPTAEDRRLAAEFHTQTRALGHIKKYQ